MGIAGVPNFQYISLWLNLDLLNHEQPMRLSGLISLKNYKNHHNLKKPSKIENYGRGKNAR